MQTRDLAGLAWNPSSSELAAWDSALTYKVLLFGSRGNLKASYSAYSDALGVRHATWSPSGQVLAVGSCDQRVRLLERVTFKPLATLEHGALLDGLRHGHVTVYHEQEKMQSPQGAHPSFRVASLPVTLPEGRGVSREGAVRLPGTGAFSDVLDQGQQLAWTTAQARCATCHGHERHGRCSLPPHASINANALGIAGWTGLPGQKELAGGNAHEEP